MQLTALLAAPLRVLPRRHATPVLPGLGWARRAAVGSDLPEPESTRRRLFIRSVALVALLASGVYLTWRALYTLDLGVWWASIPLLVLEIHAAAGLALFTFALWDVDRRPATRPVVETDARIAVLIPTYNEGVEVLLPTVAAALAMRLPHETWILDDGDRPAVRRLARYLGAHYISRPEHAHAKAGNVNHALARIEADFVAILDADHVASPDFLVRTMGYFADPRVALVQTPQDFYNLESFEHAGDQTERAQYHEQALFYRVIQPGKNRWSAAFWCGTGAVVRMTALREVGGVATETITEDIHTTIRFHRRGWRTVYHNEVLARGLAASDAETYQSQRLRWGTGAMQVLRHENPLTVPGLTLTQRVAYATTLLGWFDAWRTMGYLLMPIVVVLTGVVPIAADAAVFFPAFAITFILQQLAMRLLSRGYHRPILSLVFELVRMTPNLMATLTLIWHRGIRFKVTPKGRTGDARRPVHVPAPLVWTLVLSLVSSAWFGLTLAGLTPVRYEVPWAVYASMLWLAFNAALVWLAIRRVRALRFASERRSSVRFESIVPAAIDRLACEAHDISLTGARLVAGELPERAWHTVSFLFDDERVSLRAMVRSRRPLGNGLFVYGVEFLPAQHRRRAHLALALFGTQALPTAQPEPTLRRAA